MNSSHFFALGQKSDRCHSLHASLGKGFTVFSFLNPRAADLVLGLAIGLSLALAWHWVAWTIH